MTDNVIPVPFQRNRLGNLAINIEQMIYDESEYMSLCEAVGVLEIVKAKIIKSHSDEDE